MVEGAFNIMAIRILLSTRLGERRWSQADLARSTGIRPTTIGDLYNEFAERINLDHLDLICEALKYDVTDIIQRVGNEYPRTKSRSGKVIKKNQTTNR
jgi:putative transcriptional regulator